MTTSRGKNRSGSRAWVLATVAAIAVGPVALAQPPARPTPSASRPVRSQPASPEAAHAVQLAWLAEPATFPLSLAAKPSAAGLELSGFVPTEEIHQKAVQLARNAAPTAGVQDNIKVHAGMPVRMIAHGNPAEVELDAMNLLADTLGERANNCQVQSHPDGKLTLAVAGMTAEEQVQAAKALRKLGKCSAVVCQEMRVVSAPPTSVEAPTATFVQPIRVSGVRTIANEPMQSVYVPPQVEVPAIQPTAAQAPAPMPQVSGAYLVTNPAPAAAPIAPPPAPAMQQTGAYVVTSPTPPAPAAPVLQQTGAYVVANAAPTPAPAPAATPIPLSPEPASRTPVPQPPAPQRIVVPPGTPIQSAAVMQGVAKTPLPTLPGQRIPADSPLAKSIPANQPVAPAPVAPPVEPATPSYAGARSVIMGNGSTPPSATPQANAVAPVQSTAIPAPAPMPTLTPVNATAPKAVAQANPAPKPAPVPTPAATPNMSVAELARTATPTAPGKMPVVPPPMIGMVASGKSAPADSQLTTKGPIIVPAGNGQAAPLSPTMAMPETKPSMGSMYTSKPSTPKANSTMLPSAPVESGTALAAKPISGSLYTAAPAKPAEPTAINGSSIASMPASKPNEAKPISGSLYTAAPAKPAEPTAINGSSIASLPASKQTEPVASSGPQIVAMPHAPAAAPEKKPFFGSLYTAKANETKPANNALANLPAAKPSEAPASPTPSFSYLPSVKATEPNPIKPVQAANIPEPNYKPLDTKPTEPKPLHLASNSPAPLPISGPALPKPVLSGSAPTPVEKPVTAPKPAPAPVEKMAPAPKPIIPPGLPPAAANATGMDSPFPTSSNEKPSAYPLPTIQNGPVSKPLSKLPASMPAAEPTNTAVQLPTIINGKGNAPEPTPTAPKEMLLPTVSNSRPAPSPITPTAARLPATADNAVKPAVALIPQSHDSKVVPIPTTIAQPKAAEPVRRVEVTEPKASEVNKPLAPLPASIVPMPKAVEMPKPVEPLQLASNPLPKPVELPKLPEAPMPAPKAVEMPKLPDAVSVAAAPKLIEQPKPVAAPAPLPISMPKAAESLPVVMVPTAQAAEMPKPATQPTTSNNLQQVTAPKPSALPAAAAMPQPTATPQAAELPKFEQGRAIVTKGASSIGQGTASMPASSPMPMALSKPPAPANATPATPDLLRERTAPPRSETPPPAMTKLVSPAPASTLDLKPRSAALPKADAPSEGKALMGIIRQDSANATASLPPEQVKTAIETACMDKATNVNVQMLSNKQLRLSMVVNGSGEWDQLYAKLKKLPELASYAVIFNVSVKPSAGPSGTIPPADPIASTGGKAVTTAAYHAPAPEITTVKQTVHHVPAPAAPTTGKQLVGIIRTETTGANAESADARQQLETLCRVIDPTATVAALPNKQLKLTLAAKSQTEWTQLYNRIKKLPAASNYSVIFNVNVPQ